MSKPGIKPLRQLTGDHDYSLEDSFAKGPKVITEAAYFRSGEFVIAIGRLDLRNRWDDEALERGMSHLQRAWNDAVKAERAKGGEA